MISRQASADVACPAPADEQSNQQRARELFDQATSREAADPETARSMYTCAQSLVDRPAIALRLGSLSERLGDLETAIRSFEHYLALSGSDAPDAIEMRRHIELLRAKLTTPPAKPAEPSVTLKPIDAPQKSFMPPVPAMVLGGVGILALGSFTFFGLQAQRGFDDLKGSCAPGCSTGEIAPVKRDAFVANISIGVAGLSLLAAGIIWFADHQSHQSTR